MGNQKGTILELALAGIKLLTPSETSKKRSTRKNLRAARKHYRKIRNLMKKSNNKITEKENQQLEHMVDLMVNAMDDLL
jgi:hypothetical protein